MCACYFLDWSQYSTCIKIYQGGVLIRIDISGLYSEANESEFLVIRLFGWFTRWYLNPLEFVNKCCRKQRFLRGNHGEPAQTEGILKVFNNAISWALLGFRWTHVWSFLIPLWLIYYESSLLKVRLEHSQSKRQAEGTFVWDTSPIVPVKRYWK